jgi:hypothetical protein
MKVADDAAAAKRTVPTLEPFFWTSKSVWDEAATEDLPMLLDNPDGNATARATGTRVIIALTDSRYQRLRPSFQK